MGSILSPALSPPAAAVVAVMAAIVLFTAIKLVWGAAQWTKKSGHRIGATFGAADAEVIEWSGREGLVRAGGEIWRARASEPLAAGDRVSVRRVSGLALEVSKRSTGPADAAAPLSED